MLAEENRLQLSQLPVSRRVQDIEGCPCLQIMSFADILHLAMILGNSSAIFSLRNVKNVPSFCNSPPKQHNLDQRLPGFQSIFWQLSCSTSSKFGQRQLIMKNKPRDLSQSEKKKLFE